MKSFVSLLTLATSITSISARPTAELNFEEIEKRQYTGVTTENQLTDGTACRAVTVIFARGTSEAGNVGSIAGPPFFQALATEIGSSNLAVQGVDYGATIAGFLVGGDPVGSATMASLVEQAATQCPDTAIVMSGYSQGGQLVHNAAEAISASAAAQVSSVVIFGDPDNGDAVAQIDSSKVLIICHVGDDICAGGDLILAPHLTYGQDAQTAADFVAAQAGL